MLAHFEIEYSHGLTRCEVVPSYTSSYARALFKTLLARTSDDGGKTWRPVAFDLSDEVKTHSAMLRVASASDFTNKDAGGRVVGRSRLGDFKNAKSDEERLDVIRASNYGVKRMNLADGPINFQPAKSISDGKKPGEIVQTTAWFGRIYKP